MTASSTAAKPFDFAPLLAAGLPDEPDALHRFPCAVWASRIDVSARWELGGHVIEPKAVLG